MTFKTDFGEMASLLCLTALIIMFAGEPDIQDAIIAYLMGITP